MIFREVRAEERSIIEQIVELEEVVFGKNGGVDEWILKPFVRYGKVYVILKKHEVVGVAELMRSWSGNSVYIYGFAVKQKEQRKGFGSFLLNKLIEELKKEKLDKITLTVAQENKSAIVLYEKFDFKKTKILKDEYGKNIDRLYMEYIL